MEVTKKKGRARDYTKLPGMTQTDFVKMIGVTRQTLYMMRKRGSVKVEYAFPGSRIIYVTEWNGRKWNGREYK